MHLFFIDESGTIVPENKKHSKYFVIGGVIIPEIHWHEIYKKLKELKKQYRIHSEIKWRFFAPNNKDEDNGMKHLSFEEKDEVRTKLYNIITSYKSVKIISTVTDIEYWDSTAEDGEGGYVAFGESDSALKALLMAKCVPTEDANYQTLIAVKRDDAIEYVNASQSETAPTTHYEKAESAYLVKTTISDSVQAGNVNNANTWALDEDKTTYAISKENISSTGYYITINEQNYEVAITKVEDKDYYVKTVSQYVFEVEGDNYSDEAFTSVSTATTSDTAVAPKFNKQYFDDEDKLVYATELSTTDDMTHTGAGVVAAWAIDPAYLGSLTFKDYAAKYATQDILEADAAVTFGEDELGSLVRKEVTLDSKNTKFTSNRLS